MDNFLSAEPLLIDRLTAELGTEAETVGSITDMQEVEEQAQRTPAVYVIFDGYRPGEAIPSGTAQKLIQQWLVVAAVRNVAAVHTGAEVREDAGALIAKIIPALQGHRLSPDHSLLRMASAPSAVHRDGFSYIPTAWETTVVTKPTGA